MDSTGEFFTLKTLGEFYTDAAKAGGMEVLGYDCWHHKVEGGPRCGDRAADWRPKPAQPIVRWLIQMDDGTISTGHFGTESHANSSKKGLRYDRTGAKVIKLVQEV